MSKFSKKVSTQVNEHLLESVKKTAEKEGKPRKHIMAGFEKSLEDFDELYKTLAK
ncbi:MAG: hypothetical protein WC197_02535 [Candidatus Gastranaerophilaceae bacterium]|jgi:hypothetical protein